MDNSTLDSIYNFYFEVDDSTETEKSDSQQLQLSNITCVGVILVLIFFILILLVAIRMLTEGREIPLDDAIMMNRIEDLRKEMNASELKTPDDPNSQYRMKNNRTPENTLLEDPGYHEFGYVIHGRNGIKIQLEKNI